jgi:hypothetical protein
LKRHLETKHPEIFKKLVNSEIENDVQIQPSIKKFMVSKSSVFDHCVNLAIAGRSFSLFEDPDMKEIVKSASLNRNGTTTIDRIHVKAGVTRKAEKMRAMTIEKLKGRLISICADFANQNGVDFLGKFQSVLIKNNA